MLLSPYLSDTVIEFPRNKYVLTVKKFHESEYEYVTLSSSYKPEASYYFRWFRNMLSSCSSENAYEKITEMIEVFRSCNDEFNYNLREYVLMEGFLRVCFRLKLEDSDLVCEVLNLLYTCWHSFGPVHLAAIIGIHSKENGNYSAALMAFFLEHARRNKLQYGGIRMVDVSMYSTFKKSAVLIAAEMWNWKIMLVYLQHGAKFENSLQDRNMSQYRLSSALTEILRKLISHIWFQLVHPAIILTNRHYVTPAEYLDNLGEDVTDLCSTSNILLRALRRVQFGSLDFIIRDNDAHHTIMLIPSQEVMNHITVQTMIPKLSRRYKCPEELKHICRWTIRKQLNENWQLPQGIRDLPLPQRLKRYLNLLTD